MIVAVGDDFLPNFAHPPKLYVMEKHFLSLGLFPYLYKMNTAMISKVLFCDVGEETLKSKKHYVSKYS